MGGKCCGINHQFREMLQAKARLAQLPLHQKEIQMLHLIYTDLAERAIDKAITLQNFVLFFHKNGFWGERLFEQFDYTENNLIVQKQFIVGITKIFKTNEEKKIQLLFKEFSHNKKKRNGDSSSKSSQSIAYDQQGIGYEDFLIMLYNYPKQDLKKILNEKQFFQTQLRGSLKTIGQNRRLQSVYRMGSYVVKKKPFQCRIQQKSQSSQHNSANALRQSQPSAGSMVGRNILKNLKQDKTQQTSIQFNDGQQIIAIKTNNFHHLVKRFAQKMFKDMKIDRKNQKMSRIQFQKWILKHKKLYDTYYSGFHNQIWQIDQSTQEPMYMSIIFEQKSECKYVSPRTFLSKDDKFLQVQAILVHSIILITHQKQLGQAYQTICLQGLAVNKAPDSILGKGICISHRDGIYQKRQLFFKDQQRRSQWLEALKYYKGQSISNLYTVGIKIGAGKFSVVYEGTQKETGDKYAIKVIQSYRLEQEQKEQIAHQTNIMQVLSHPLLVQFKDTIQTKTHLYIIEQLCPGKDLFEFVKDYKHLQEYEASIITQQIIVGLRYMHSLGIVHRDVKPQNIVVSYVNGKIDKIKIIDFGFANYLQSLQQLPPQQNLAGTPNYIAPQLLRREIITFKIDVFALGAILYYMLSGSLPFNDFNLTQIFKKTLDGHYEFPQKLFSKVSTEAKDLISQFLKNDPNQRIGLESALNHPWFKVAQANKEKKTLKYRKVGSLVQVF